MFDKNNRPLEEVLQEDNNQDKFPEEEYFPPSNIEEKTEISNECLPNTINFKEYCYKMNPKSADSKVKILRANLVQTAILFKDNLNMELLFNFGITRNAKCRQADIQDIIALGLKNSEVS